MRRKRSRYNAKTRLQEMTKKVREELNNDTSTSEESNIQNEIDEDLDNSKLEDEKIDKLDIPIPEHNEENQNVEKDMNDYIVGHRVKRSKKKSNKNSETNVIEENTEEENNTKGSKNGKKIAITSAVTIIIAGVAYCSVAYGYYGNRLLPNTYVNGIDYSNETADKVTHEIKKQIENYSLTIKKGGETIDTIKGSDLGISLANESEKEVVSLIKKQNKLLWPLSFKNKTNLNISGVVVADSNKLSEIYTNLKVLSVPVTAEYQDAKVLLKNGKFVVQAPIPSDEIDDERLKSNILSCVSSLTPELNLDDGNCYVQGESNTDTEALQKICDEANAKYPNLNIKIMLEGSDINLAEELVPDALVVSDNGSVSVTSDSIDKAIAKAKEKYSTVGETVKFKTAHGDTVEVSGGDYGNIMKVDGLKALLEKGILKGEGVNASVPYKSNCLNNNPKIEGTYVEVDLTNQYLYMFVNGKKVVETPVVTGKVGARATPQGVYMLKNKIMDVPLVGDNYVTPVKYWMPFNGGIGLHDAVWQSAFGGERYKTKGSHGCVNLPMSKAKEIYENATVGMPVVCYYHDKLSGFDVVKSPDPVMSTYRGLTANEQKMLSDIKHGKKAQGAVYDSNVGENAKKYGNKDVSNIESLKKAVTSESISEYAPEEINPAENEGGNDTIKDNVATPAGIE